MEKKSKNHKYVPILVSMGPMIWGFCLWSRLPHNMPMLFDQYGRVIFTIPKTVPILVMPTMFALLTFAILQLYEKNKHDRRRSAVLEKIAWWGIPVFSQVFVPLMYYTSLGYDINIFKTGYIFWGIVFILVGNHLYKCRQNETAGIVLPWTVQDPDNWKYTTRIAGVVFVIGGVFLVANALVGNMILIGIVLLSIIIIPTVCSYLYDKKKRERRQ